MSGDPWDPYGVLKTPGIRLLRQSYVSTGDICLQRLGYDLDPNVPSSNGEARIVGTGYHAGMQAYYEARMLREPLSLDAVQAAAEAGFYGAIVEHPNVKPWVTSEAEALQRVHDMVAAYFDKGGPWGPEYEVLGVEWEWFLPLPGRPGWGMKGSADLILRGPNGVIIDDHKTAGKKWPRGKESPHKHVQPPTYWWAVQSGGVQPYAFTFSIMTYKGELDRRWISVTEPQVEALLRKARGYVDIVTAVPLDQLPTNPSSNLCSEMYCDHWERCPGGALTAQVS